MMRTLKTHLYLIGSIGILSIVVLGIPALAETSGAAIKPDRLTKA